MNTRTLQQVIEAQPTSDGAGVKLRRSIGAAPGLRLDPFLMLDEFSSEDAADYIAGFPAHPHRGFETVTYMLDGRMRHEDHLGNRGDLGPGDVQWMTAARGIIHSEMPQQQAGRMHGFQLWLNLPAREKMKPAAWRDIPSASIPAVALSGGGRVRLIAGRVELEGRTLDGAVTGLSTEPLYLDVQLPAQGVLALPLPPEHQAFVYAYEGELRIGERVVPHHAAGVLSAGARLAATAGAQGARFLLLAGKPLREPVVQYGPFVMNTREEIEQALEDYRSGRLAA
jgi:redox-sensitive bicupin YhaK (pirin superfamily)